MVRWSRQGHAWASEALKCREPVSGVAGTSAKGQRALTATPCVCPGPLAAACQSRGCCDSPAPALCQPGNPSLRPPGLGHGCPRNGPNRACFREHWPALPEPFLAGDTRSETYGLDPEPADVNGNALVDISGTWIRARVPLLCSRPRSVQGERSFFLLTGFGTSSRGLISSAVVR